ncbi:7576_t:CDS:2 [Paraglomus occultum]|uniref:7576_t:CDS:1 n=1 Tax=Paraglomus occultum TaxID=144539 RepID=A0A9N9AA21_9GLOM|nr:7576_t:CDS:2 [Paraglomus occultum]
MSLSNDYDFSLTGECLIKMCEDAYLAGYHSITLVLHPPTKITVNSSDEDGMEYVHIIHNSNPLTTTSNDRLSDEAESDDSNGSDITQERASLQDEKTFPEKKSETSESDSLKITDIHFLQRKERNEIAELLADIHSPTNQAPRYKVSEKIPVELLKDKLKREYALTMMQTRHFALSGRKPKLATDKDTKLYTKGLKAAYRLGAVFAFALSHPKLITWDEIVEATSASPDDLRKAIKFAIRIYELFKILGNEAFNKAQNMQLNFMNRLDDEQYSVLIECLKSIKKTK